MNGAEIGTLVTAVAALLGALAAWIRADVASRTATRAVAQTRKPAVPAPAAPTSPAPAGTTPPAASEEVK